MTLTVSVSQFRQHISNYLEKAKEGDTVIVKDEKRDKQIAQLTGKRKFNPETFGKALKAAAGIFTVDNHPEWKTKKDVTGWVTKGRLSADRSI